MQNIFYLLNISVSGIKNINNEICLNFYKKTVDKNFNPDKYRIKAIYGENGSGKSAIITAVKIFQDLLINYNYLNESKNQNFLDEIVNKTTHIFKFKVEFLSNLDPKKTIYNYSVCIAKNQKGLYEIQSETLKCKNGNYPNNNYKLIFHSENGELLFVNCSDKEKKIIEKKSSNLLSSRSFIYLYIIDICDKIKFVHNTFNNVSLFYEDKVDNIFLADLIATLILVLSIRVFVGEDDQHEMYFLQKKLNDNALDKQNLLDEIFGNKDCFSPFLNINNAFINKKYFKLYKKKVNQLTRFIKIFKPTLKSIDIDVKENDDLYICNLNLNYGNYSINKEFESTGIKKLIMLFDCFLSASTNGIVFIDEMDSNLNDIYLCKLIEYFMYYGKGQLCFTTHNLDPMSVLKENKNSIDFLSSDNHLVPWLSHGNASPENCYKNGMIEDSPFNIDATDFIGILGE